MSAAKQTQKRKAAKRSVPEKETGSTSKQARKDTMKNNTYEAGDQTMTKNPNDSTGSSGDQPKPTDRLPFSFYDVDCEDLAKRLLGQTLVRLVDGKRLSGKIVETESYIGPVDKAAHSYKGKRTARTEAMFMPAGTAYVYNIYGIYCCLNISSRGDGAAVLIRALEPLENLPVMDKNRIGQKGKSLLKKEGKELCNGPSKLCRALAVTKDSSNQVDMCTSDSLWLEKGETVGGKEMVKSKRINIGYAEDWVDKLLRFYVLGNRCVSVRDKEAEKAMNGE